MSFLEILQKAREEAKLKKVEQKDVEKLNNVEQDLVEQKKVYKNETSDHIYLGDAIVNSSKVAMINSKKLNKINAAVRLAKKLITGHITHNELNKCFKMQDRFPQSKNINYQLVGGDAMAQLQKLLNKGVALDEALNKQIER